MSNKELTCGLLGAQEYDLFVLSELQKQPHVQISFVYDKDPSAVGVEIAEILGIPRYHRPEDLMDLAGLDYVVVSEPRARFREELEAVARMGAEILNPPEAVEAFGGQLVIPPEVQETAASPYTIEDTFSALEKLFDRRELLKFLLDVAVKATSASAGSIMLYSVGAKELYIAYALGLSDRVISNTRQKLGDGIAGTVALEKRAKLISLDKGTTLYTKDRERTAITSAISVPLMWENELLGVLNVSANRGEPELNRKDLETLKKLSSRISRVLSESLNIQKVQIRHREWKFRSTLGEIAEKNLATQEKFSLLSKYLAELMGSETVEIYLSTHEGDWFILGGSNHWLTPKTQRMRCKRGALNRCFLDQRCAVLTESSDRPEDPMAPLTSLVYCPLTLNERFGVLVLEFVERYKLDEFLIVKDAIVLEVCRFIASEVRERRLRRELESLGRVSEAAPALLSCSSLEDLCDILSRAVATVLECHRVSVRLRAGGEDDLVTRYHEPPGERSDAWKAEDEKRLERLVKKKESFALAFLDFERNLEEEKREYHSLLAHPILDGDTLIGAIIAYDKHPLDPMEDATFGDLDQVVLKNLGSLVLPVIKSLSTRGPAAVEEAGATYAELLQGNLERLKMVCASEIFRSDRYHHTFSLILFKIRPLEDLFVQDSQRALVLVDEITRGIQTRTRKTDFGAWISKSTFAMLSLEGSKRLRFLTSRIMLYLTKDFSTMAEAPLALDDILLGWALYPGTVRTAEDLLLEAEKNLKPYAAE
jgi:transcriptional regulator with GAF, ATPase, and Fis domain